MEKWKDIDGYEGLYQVSDCGNVKNNKGCYLKPNKCNNYYKVQLSKNGVKRYYRIHRLVAMAFVPNPYNKPYVDHIDSNPTNNVASNLRWCTMAENNLNPETLKKRRKRIIQYDENGRIIRIFDSIKSAAETYGFSASAICDNLKGNTSSSYLYTWKYAPPMAEY